MDNNNLENIASMFLRSNQGSGQQQPIETANVAGNNLLVNRPTNFNSRLSAGLAPLQQLASNFLMMQKQKKQQDFMKQVTDTMSADLPLEDSTNGGQVVPGKKTRMGKIGLEIMNNDPELGKQLGADQWITEALKAQQKSKGNDLEYQQDLADIKAGKEIKVAKERANIKKQQEDEKLVYKQAEDAKKQEQRSQFVKQTALDTLKTIEEIDRGIGNFGFFGGVPSIPGSDRFNWEQNVNRLLSGRILKVMTEMKEASKTGATGFGQLSNRELGVLENASTALKRGTSPKDAKRYLNDMKTMLNKVAQPEGTEMPHPLENAEITELPKVGQMVGGGKVKRITRKK